jgi:hypothetical protein
MSDIMTLFFFYLRIHKIIYTKFSKCCLIATVKYKEKKAKSTRIMAIFSVKHLFLE